jgi:ribulose 1,5-bisphosphate synthetase/thiazole synthase
MMAETARLEADVPIVARPQVAVVGGGIAGVCAAVSAARQGAKVLLVERYNVLGGNATAGGVGGFCGETRGQGEVFDEIIAGLDEVNAIADYAPYEEREARTFDHEWLKFVLQELILSAGVRLLLHATLVAAEAESRRVQRLIVGCKGELLAVEPAVVVDATGDADVVEGAGFECFHEGAGAQLPMSQMTFVRDVGERVDVPLPGSLEPIVNTDDLPMTSVWEEPRGKAGIKIKVEGYDATDPWSLTAAEVEARRRSARVIDYLRRERMPERVLDHSTHQVGVREGRRAVGDYVLTEDDLREGRRFEDDIAVGRFYLDFHDPSNAGRTYAVERTQVPPYGIPLRSLIARDATNLLVAGRCLSCDQVALSSARVMTTCAMMGQAAGIAAAWAADPDGVANVDAGALREELKGRGAEL